MMSWRARVPALRFGPGGTEIRAIFAGNHNRLACKTAALYPFARHYAPAPRQVRLSGLFRVLPDRVFAFFMPNPSSMSTVTQINARIGKYRWTICALLFFATTVNYLDRQVLSLLKGDLEREFNWSDSDYANILTVFQFVYAISMLFAGRIIDWLGTKSGYAWSLIVWSVGAMVHALAKGTGGFMIARGILGFGESGNFPAAIKTTAEWFPKKERALATGIFNSGTNVGAILAPLTVPWLALNWGWQGAFIIVGGIGFLWLIFWFWLYDTPA
jgi:sugar phosphate permease